MKTKEELNALKKEVDTLNKKLAELTEEDLEQVTGGGAHLITPVIESPVIGTTVSEPSVNEIHYEGRR